MNALFRCRCTPTTMTMAFVLYVLLLGSNCGTRGFDLSSSSFVKRSQSCKIHSSSSYKNTLSMDLESPNARESKLVQKWKLSFRKPCLPFTSPFSNSNKDQRDSAGPKTKLSFIPKEHLHGMPWKDSIDGNYTKGSPYYLPFWEYEIEYMEKHLTNLRVLPVTSQATGNDLAYAKSNAIHPMRMHTLQLASDEFRLIRMTVMDAGTRSQVFTSVWYPDPKYDTPILGVDLLQFGQRKHTCVMDFQPLHQKDNDSNSPAPLEYEHLMAPIRNRYPSLHERLSHKFYDETQFFSQQMLLGRQDDPALADQMVFDEFFPAFQEYFHLYLDLHLKHATPRPDREQANLQRQAAYDVYSAERDPAHGLFSKCFGHDFAEDYVNNILFPFSKRPPSSTTR